METIEDLQREEQHFQKSLMPWCYKLPELEERTPRTMCTKLIGSSQCTDCQIQYEEETRQPIFGESKDGIINGDQAPTEDLMKIHAASETCTTKKWEHKAVTQD
ncbi:hypothetical protein ATANTOWER_030920 [Ataeniobius toweri]|uniref:Uncharacterized protein n=1 Tax=Ataeniobius toweri TaxID=208326 RepID=A0ABU7B956_9TELE|nr:hypothetical protein [Ataeniobius toweri]